MFAKTSFKKRLTASSWVMSRTTLSAVRDTEQHWVKADCCVGLTESSWALSRTPLSHWNNVESQNIHCNSMIFKINAYKGKTKANHFFKTRATKLTHWYPGQSWVIWNCSYLRKFAKFAKYLFCELEREPEMGDESFLFELLKAGACFIIY